MAVKRDIEKYAKDYLEDKFEFVMSKYRKNMILEMLKKYKPKNIVDIGPAYNYIFNDYKDFDSYTIVEPSKIMCDKILTSSRNVKGVNVINNLIENVDNTEFKNVDFVIASVLIHEVENPQIFLKKIHSICNKDTIMHISAPNNNSFHLVYAKEAGLISKIGEITDYSKKMQRLRTYNMKSLEELVSNCGFKIVEKGPFYFKFFNQTKMEKCIEEEMLTEDLLNALVKMAYIMPEYSAEIWINGRIK